MNCTATIIMFFPTRKPTVEGIALAIMGHMQI